MEKKLEIRNQKLEKECSAAVVQSKITYPKSEMMQLYPYQIRWVEDNSPLKIVLKARQIGYSFAATLRIVFECMKRRTTWILLSKGERQSRALMEKVQEHIHACGMLAETRDGEYFEGTTLKQLETRFPNGSVIYALPANPDTARGYSGNVTLDEFAFHQDADKIYSALYPTITRGYQLEVISTPNGPRGKFYDLARAAGLADEGAGCLGLGARARNEDVLLPQPLVPSTWSSHRCDIYEAVRQGLQADLHHLRAGCEDDVAWRQEFCCQFVSSEEDFFAPELISSCSSSAATTEGARCLGLGAGTEEDFQPNSQPPAPSTQSPASSTFFLGIDIGRKHDRTVFWVDEVHETHIESLSGRAIESSTDPMTQWSNGPMNEWTAGSVAVARLVKTLSNVPFDEQLAYARDLLSRRGGNGAALITRAAIDATGIGAPLAESLAREFGARVEPVVFTAAVKEDLAYRTRRRMENGQTLLPDARDIRRAFAAVKKFVTVTGNLRFDAARTDSGHADEFWAKALADYAAAARPAAGASDGFLADAQPIISHAAFFHFGEGGLEALKRSVF